MTVSDAQGSGRVRYISATAQPVIPGGLVIRRIIQSTGQLLPAGRWAVVR